MKMNFFAHPNGFRRTQWPAVITTPRLVELTDVAEHWNGPLLSFANTFPWTVFGGRAESGTSYAVAPASVGGGPAEGPPAGGSIVGAAGGTQPGAPPRAAPARPGARGPPGA